MLKMLLTTGSVGSNTIREFSLPNRSISKYYGSLRCILGKFGAPNILLAMRLLER